MQELLLTQFLPLLTLPSLLWLGLGCFEFIQKGVGNVLVCIFSLFCNLSICKLLVELVCLSKISLY
jgi:hypothetical protein